MACKQTGTQRVVRLLAVRGISPSTLAQYQALRAEAGRLWTALVQLHAQARARGQWLSAGDLEPATKGGQYALHRQSVQAPCQTLAAKVATAVALRKQEYMERGDHPDGVSPPPKPFQTVVWKDQALQILPSGQLWLPTGGPRP